MGEVDFKLVNSRFLEVELDSYKELVEVKDFCFKGGLLYKVIVNKVTNKAEYLKGDKPQLEEGSFDRSSIPTAVKGWIDTFQIAPYSKQCEE